LNIGIFELEPWERAVFKALEEDHSVQYFHTRLNLETIHQAMDCEVISTFIYSGLDRAVLSRLPNLKMIAVRATGLDHVDLEYCRQRLIQVLNVPDYGKNTVAEHTFGLLLTIAHHLYESIDRTRRGDFTTQGLQGFDLQGKTLGVIGTGSIGSHVVRIAGGFGMDVLAFDSHPDPSLSKGGALRYVSWGELLSQSDILTLHVPSTPETRNLLSEAAFQQMKPGVVILNTARGDLIDVEALVKALATGKVSAAGLDVLPEEPVLREEAEVLRAFYQHQHQLRDLLADHLLLRLRHVFVTPHNAFNTREAVGRISKTTLENIQKFLAATSPSRSASAECYPVKIK
jgi:D-lactate dehydrogenase